MSRDDRITEPGYYEVSHPANTHMVESKQVPGEMHSVAYSDDGKRSGRGAVTFRKVDESEIAQDKKPIGTTSADDLFVYLMCEFLTPIAHKAGQKTWAFVEKKGGELIDSIVQSRRKGRAQRKAKPTVPHSHKPKDETAKRAGELLNELGFSSDPSCEASPEQLLEIDSAMLEKYWGAYLNAKRHLKAHEGLLRRSALARCLILMPLDTEPSCPGAEQALLILREDPKLETIENLERIVPILLDDLLWSSAYPNDIWLYEVIDMDALNRAFRRHADNDKGDEGGNDTVAEPISV